MTRIAERLESMKARAIEVCAGTKTKRGPEHKHPAFRVNSRRNCLGKEDLDSPSQFWDDYGWMD
jgi:hypothetical protein